MKFAISYEWMKTVFSFFIHVIYYIQLVMIQIWKSFIVLVVHEIYGEYVDMLKMISVSIIKFQIVHNIIFR